jgi:hypothetical protein
MSGPNAYVGQTYSDEIDYLKNWITNHFNWMDEELSSLVGIDDPQNLVPSKFILSQNYPNPFNPTTKIKFTIPSVILSGAKNLNVTLKVYDVLGREVATLVNEEKQPGVYEVELVASQLSSGIYFYTLEAGEFRDTKKLIFLK